jgi:hypothetical protein
MLQCILTWGPGTYRPDLFYVRLCFDKGTEDLQTDLDYRLLSYIEFKLYCDFAWGIKDLQTTYYNVAIRAVFNVFFNVFFWRENANGSVFSSVIARISTLQSRAITDEKKNAKNPTKRLWKRLLKHLNVVLGWDQGC